MGVVKERSQPLSKEINILLSIALDKYCVSVLLHSVACLAKHLVYFRCVGGLTMLKYPRPRWLPKLPSDPIHLEVFGIYQRVGWGVAVCSQTITSVVVMMLISSGFRNNTTKLGGAIWVYDMGDMGLWHLD